MARHVPECPACGGPDYVPHDRDECARKLRAENRRLREALQKGIIPLTPLTRPRESATI